MNHIFPQSEDNILEVPIYKRVFMFWQSPSTTPPPGYLELCIETLVRFHKNLVIIFLNYDNLPLLIGEEIDLRAFSVLSLPMQSDVLKVYFTYKYGGTFMDADMLFVDTFDLLQNSDSDKLCMLGVPGKYLQMALFHSCKPNNFLLWHILQMQVSKLSILPPGCKDYHSIPWDYVGNSIVNPMAFESEKLLKSQLSIIPTTSMYLEDKFELSQKYDPAVGLVPLYQEFYFSNYTKVSIEEIINTPQHGIVILHNSWTPIKYKTMSANEFMQQDILLARIFQHILQTNIIDDNLLIKIPIAQSSTLTNKTYEQSDVEKHFCYTIIRDYVNKGLMKEMKEIKNSYENSTSWKLTQPMRAISRFIKKFRQKKLTCKLLRWH